MIGFKSATSAVFLAGLCMLSASVMAHEEMYRGIYIYGFESNYFSPCDSEKEYWVDGLEWILSPLYQDIERGKPYPWETLTVSVYIEFRGQLLNEELELSFARQSDGLIWINELKSFTLDLPSNCKIPCRKDCLRRY